MAQTAKNIVDSILNILNKFKITDEMRVNYNWVYYKINQIRAELIVKQYLQTKQMEHIWLSPSMPITFHPTNYADKLSVTDDFVISKATIPQTVSVVNMDQNYDLGIFRLESMRGNTQYYYERMSMWKYKPAGHVLSKFKYYDRNNVTLFVNDNPTELLLTAILLNPEDGYLRNTTPIPSGSLVNGVVYLNKYNQIIYDGAVIAPNATFTATATATFTGNGTVYLNSEAVAVTDVDPYPASGDIIRQIEFEILTKEFRIEAGQLTDVRNDSVDDANKTQTV